MALTALASEHGVTKDGALDLHGGGLGQVAAPDLNASGSLVARDLGGALGDRGLDLCDVILGRARAWHHQGAHTLAAAA